MLRGTWVSFMNKARLRAHQRTYLDVFKVNFGVLAEVNDGPEEVEEALVGFKAFKQLNEALCCELFMVQCT